MNEFRGKTTVLVNYHTYIIQISRQSVREMRAESSFVRVKNR